MTRIPYLAGLGIDSPMVNRGSSNFLPPTWPPPPDFPVVVDHDGNVICRYSDPVWNVSLWAGKQLLVNFGDAMAPTAKGAISSVNANLLRCVAAWWLWGPKSIRSARTFVSRFNILRRLFVYCSKHGVRADHLYRFPKIVDGLGKALAGALADTAVTLLHDLLEHRDSIGFMLLDKEGMKRFVASLPKHEREQTPYIPPRIWLYQVKQLELFLTDFYKHRERLERCYLSCLEIYSKHYGSLSYACMPKQVRQSIPSPFSALSSKWTEEQIANRQGSFQEIAEKHGVADLLARWCLSSDSDTARRDLWIRDLSRYFRMAGAVGTAYLLNFSMMRIEEAWSLRSDCLLVEHDRKFGDIYLLRGETTKTDPDDDARWVACSKVEPAIQAMALVTRLKLVAAASTEGVPLTTTYAANPHLVVRGYEPWNNSTTASESFAVRPGYPSYQSVVEEYPTLFDPDQLRITASDLAIARRVTPSLDPESFAVGEVWPLAWHQLRRTGAVNMQASGIVSDSSVQYQLKHATRAMSLYYGHGHSNVHLNNAVRSEYLRTMYEIMGKEIKELLSDRFVSPHGKDHKAIQLELVTEQESRDLAKAARQGLVSYKETLLGGCTRRGPCEYGGVDNVVRCGGGDGKEPCGEALYDRDRELEMRRLQEIYQGRLATAGDSRYRESLLAQIKSVENALEAIA